MNTRSINVRKEGEFVVIRIPAEGAPFFIVGEDLAGLWSPTGVLRAYEVKDGRVNQVTRCAAFGPPYLCKEQPDICHAPHVFDQSQDQSGAGLHARQKGCLCDPLLKRSSMFPWGLSDA